jgi:hypothetical protein
MNLYQPHCFTTLQIIGFAWLILGLIMLGAMIIYSIFKWYMIRLADRIIASKPSEGKAFLKAVQEYSQKSKVRPFLTDDEHE